MKSFEGRKKKVGEDAEAREGGRSRWGEKEGKKRAWGRVIILRNSLLCWTRRILSKES